MLDYKNSKIYKLKSDLTWVPYIGATTGSLYNRLSYHKKKFRDWKGTGLCCLDWYNNLVVEPFTPEDVGLKIELIEEYPCENMEQLDARINYWLEQISASQSCKKEDRAYGGAYFWRLLSTFTLERKKKKKSEGQEEAGEGRKLRSHSKKIL
jgi:hypothetical protein